MNIFVVNAGSSSMKFQIIKTDLDMIEKHSDKMLAKGLVERIGSQALVSIKIPGGRSTKHTALIKDHKAAFNHIIEWLAEEETKIEGIKSIGDIHAIGHRTVHGGEQFAHSVKIDDEVLKAMEDNIELAPLHNPANLKGIYAAREVFGPKVPQVAIFDTAFHHTLEDSSYLYAIPYQYYRRYKIRRYGFHGTSHRYIAYKYRSMKKISREETNIITVHLGNGASVCAIKGGKSIDTSMGFTPLEGLIMGTRSGDIDPSVIEFLAHKEGATMDEVFNILNKRSGLLGISGLTNDMRDLEEEEREHNDRRASLAIDMFCKRVKKYIGAYIAEMNGADAICFAGGIGENSSLIRSRICSDMDWFGLKLDEKANEKAVGGVDAKICSKDSKLEVYVLPTNEELVLARDTCRVVLGAPVI
jgi:acetate kinase